MTEHFNAYEQAEAEIKPAWYEIGYRKFQALSALTVLCGYYSYEHFVGSHSDTMRLVGGAVGLIGILIDRGSTVYAMKAMKTASNAGIEAKHSEANPFVEGITSPKEFLTNPKGIALDGVAIGISIWNPGSAVGFSGVRILATLNNARVAKRYNRAEEIAQTNISENPTSAHQKAD